MIKKYIFSIIFIVDASVLFTQISKLSISYSEATLLYGDFSFLQLIIQSSLYMFGENDFALRLPMILMHLASIILLYMLSNKYLNRERDKIWLILLFILLPGVISSALVVNSAGLVIFGLFLFIHIYENYSKYILYIVSFIYVFIDSGFVYLFLGMSVYHLINHDKYPSIFNILLFFLSIYLFKLEIYGIPTGHFLDIIGIYATIFTPFIFIFIFYALYRRYLANQTDYIWYIATVSLIVSLLLSLRQRVVVEHFAPYLIIALPLVAQTFINSYRVRLKMFRMKYKIIFVLSFVFLVFNYAVVIFHKELYLVLENPKKHFAYNSHIAHDLAKKLKAQSINCVSTDEKMALRLFFYDIKNCKYNILKENKLNANIKSNVTISYKNKILYSATVTKLNTK